MSTSSSAVVSTTKRRWFVPRFSLRTLFVFITVLSVPLGLLGRGYFRQRLLIVAIEKLRESGSSVEYARRTRHLNDVPIAKSKKPPTEPAKLIGARLAVTLALEKSQCEALAGVANVIDVTLNCRAFDAAAIAPLKNALANRRLTSLEFNSGTPIDSPILEIPAEVLDAVVSAEKIDELVLCPYELDLDDVETLRTAEIDRVFLIGRLTPAAAQAIVDRHDLPQFDLGLCECTIELLEIFAKKKKSSEFGRCREHQRTSLRHERNRGGCEPLVYGFRD